MSRRNEGLASSDLQGEIDSFKQSFPWLEDNGDLDLRLGLEDYQRNLREENSQASRGQLKKPASFRHNLSISRLSLHRPSQSYSRPATRDTNLTTATYQRSNPPSAGHNRKNSRTLSLISGNRQKMAENNAFDATAAHYQDPEARMKLRVYLASPQKFDEALEFGFPSLDETSDQSDQCSSQFRPLEIHLDKELSMDDDDKASTYSDHSTATDLDSPKTPTLMEKPTVVPGDYSLLPRASREMTLRMTLTRPDLRAEDEKIYGWQQGAVVQKSHLRSDSWTPSIHVRELTPKESIEKQLATLDEENFGAHDEGVVRRFWKRVRRV